MSERPQNIRHPNLINILLQDGLENPGQLSSGPSNARQWEFFKSR